MTSFLNACGLSGPFFLSVQSPSSNGVETHSFQQPYAIVGRDPRADISFEDHDLSRRHVYIQVIEGWAYWIDLESRTGVRGPDGTSQKSGWLEFDRPISIGPLEISRPASTNTTRSEAVRPHTARESPFLALSYGRSVLPNVALEFLNGPTRSELWPMHRVMSLIGSSRACKFRLTDRSVSPFHASLVRTGSGLWIIDLRGASSIIVNETAVRCVRLTDGDILGIGRYRVRVRYQMWERSNRDRTGMVAPESEPSHRKTPAGNELALIERGSSALGYEPGDSAYAGSRRAGLESPASQVPGVQIVPLEATFPAHMDETMISQSIVVPLVNQFSMMQQQMFDQFQQSMGMLVQMFSTMHRDQMEVIHEELGRLKELTGELHSLKIELASRPSGPRMIADLVTDSVTAASSSVPDLEEIERMLANARSAGSSSNSFSTPSAAPASVGQRSASPVAAPGASGPLSRPAGASSISEPELTPEQVAALTVLPTALINPEPSPQAARSARPLTQRGAAPGRSAGASAPNAAVPGPPQPQSPAAVGTEDSNSVAWLHQRIMTLQSERESRWQKILKLLPGHS